MASESSMNLAELIQTVMTNLELIRAELSYPASDPATGLATPKVSASTVRQLKLSIDQFRLFLWAYVDTWALGGSDPKMRMRSIRIECAAELLGQLANDLRSSGVPETGEARRLNEQLQNVASLMH